jgi:adenylate kinase
MIEPQLIVAREQGIIFDGFPRTLAQARFLTEHLRIDIVFNLSLREDILVRKLLGRRVCQSCKKSFNIEDVNEEPYIMPPMLPKHGDPSCCDACKDSND